MGQSKKRILVLNEFSQLSTGFSKYGRFLLPYLYNTGKYEIAEFATYINKYHPAIDTVPWKVYANEPDPDNPQEQQIYQQNRVNQFGLWKFDQVCMDFQPDMVLSWRDFWMDEWISKSPFRKHFKWIHMPTVDGEPQKSEWLEAYKTCDKVITYSKWGKNLLEKQTAGKIKVFDVASPGTDLKTFVVPFDKAKLRETFHLKNDLFLINTVMRNQPRKLFPDIFKAFVQFLEKCRANGKNDIAQKTFLLLHTSYPDVGWDLPLELKRYGISHKVLFTHMCDQCGAVYPAFWDGEISVCRNCKGHTCRLPNTANGVNEETLAKIMGCADLYLQISISEGWAVPINDAKACGVPVMAVDYSAMSEQCYNGGGSPVPVLKMVQEPLNQTYQLRASAPDITNLSNQIYDFFVVKTQDQRNALGKEARDCVEQYYNWDFACKVWENAIDSLDCPDQSQTWFSPPKLIQPNLNIPNNLSNDQFVGWCYRHVLGEPEQIYSPMAQKAIAILDLGYELVYNEEGKPVKHPVNRNNIVQHMLGYLNQKNQYEQTRYQKLVLKQDQQVQKMNVVEV